MKLLRYASVLGAGFFTGFVYNKISNKCEFPLFAADKIDMDYLVSKCVEKYLNKHTSLVKHGLPGYDTLRMRDNFVLSYDRRNKVPHWVMEHLTSDNIEGSVCRGNNKYYIDDDTISVNFRSTLSDYKHSGYNKGHLASAENYRYSNFAYRNTFVFSNLTPQDGHFNQKIWHALETHVRDLVKQYGSVYVCSGPLYLPSEVNLGKINSVEGIKEVFSQEIKRNRKRQKMKKCDPNYSQPKQERKYVIYEVIGENNVAVPTHFFKIIICEDENDQYDMEAYIIPNEPVSLKIPIAEFTAERDTIEKYAGLVLFANLPSDKLRCINGKECIPDNLDTNPIEILDANAIENLNTNEILSSSPRGL